MINNLLHIYEFLMKSSLLGMLVTANCNLIIQVLKHKLRGVNCLQWVYCLLNASFGLAHTAA